MICLYVEWKKKKTIDWVKYTKILKTTTCLKRLDF